MFKVAAVIQGDCRGVTEKVINFYKKRADVVILSTWINENISQSILDKNLYVIKNDFPINPGGTHRNYQRLSAHKGLKLAKSLNCTHALKIRTDMIITAFYPKLWIFLLKWLIKDLFRLLIDAQQLNQIFYHLFAIILILVQLLIC